jgi:hypothetical protein
MPDRLQTASPALIFLIAAPTTFFTSQPATVNRVVTFGMVSRRARS